ncbi:hypothetical protein GDO78_017113 [Eleutherodactylus coqui]|uniref:Uncharacterized protein n=1 Tax=Eleutherodactylus coqui TaxID=57060 RepID=A0A8J6C2X8_ELECQ|nr:hypothetical protein GDO78_017113 [Eleutherodactylus coqui]
MRPKTTFTHLSKCCGALLHRGQIFFLSGGCARRAVRMHRAFFSFFESAGLLQIRSSSTVIAVGVLRWGLQWKQSLQDLQRNGACCVFLPRVRSARQI